MCIDDIVAAKEEELEFLTSLKDAIHDCGGHPDIVKGTTTVEDLAIILGPNNVRFYYKEEE